MLREPITMEPSEESEVRELNRMLNLGTCALVGLNGEHLELPPSVYNLLKGVVANMARGRTIFLTPANNRLTTQAAANILGFSRPHLVKLLDAGAIAFERVGQHRRVLMKDIMAFQKERDAERKAALNDLAREEYESGSYEGIPLADNGSNE